MAKQIKRLDQKQFYHLVGYVQREYVASDVPDRTFAEQASKSLGYEISETSVASARDIVGVAAWKDRHAAPKSVDWHDSFTLLRKTVELLTQRVVAQEDANGRMHNRIHALEDELRRMKDVITNMTYVFDNIKANRQPHSGQG